MNDTGMENTMQQGPWAEYYFTTTEDGEAIQRSISLSDGQQIYFVPNCIIGYKMERWK